MIVMAVIVVASQVVLALWQEQSLYFKEKQAYYLAESGIEYARAMLSEDPSWRPRNPVVYGGGQFAIEFSGGAITAYGTYGGLTRRVTWRLGGDVVSGLGSINRVLHSETSITLQEGSRLDVSSGESYIGGDLIINKGARAYFNDLYLTGRLRVNKGGIFQISGRPHQGSQAEPMLKPGWAELRRQATKELSPGSLKEKYDLGDGNLVVLDGDLDLGDIEIRGWGTIAVNGNLRLQGEIRASPGPMTIVVMKNCYLFGATFDGLLYVYGTVHSFKHWGPNQIKGALWAERINGGENDLKVIYDDRLRSGVLWRNRADNGIWSE